MHDKRHHKRFMVEGMELNGKMMFATEVSVHNISISGMSVKADRRLDIGKEYSITLRDHGRVITVKGLVVWSSLVSTTPGHAGEAVPVYAAGMKFTDVMSERISEIISFIEHHAHGTENRLSGLRFSISAPDSAVLQFPSHFIVKKISAGGMLIESTQALTPEEHHPMELSIPEEQPILFTGRVASCAMKSDNGLEHFDIGIEFLHIDQEGHKRLNDFIAMLSMMDKNP